MVNIWLIYGKDLAKNPTWIHPDCHFFGHGCILINHSPQLGWMYNIQSLGNRHEITWTTVFHLINGWTTVTNNHSNHSTFFMVKSWLNLYFCWIRIPIIFAEVLMVDADFSPLFWLCQLFVCLQKSPGALKKILNFNMTHIIFSFDINHQPDLI